MPRKLHNALTPMTVRKASPGRHADGNGLYLRVQDGESRSWLFRAAVNGKVREFGLGPAAGADALSLARAREVAREYSSRMAKGESLEGKRAKARKAAADTNAAASKRKSFRDVGDAYVKANEGTWKNDKHRAQWRATLTGYIYPKLGDLPVSDVGTDQVMEVLEPIWSAKPETASRVRGRIETILDAAKVKGLRTGENPARWRGHLDKLLPNVTKAKAARNKAMGRGGHHAAIPYAEVPGFMAKVRAKGVVSAWALEFTVLCASRTGEVIGATWAEVDLDAAVWTIPGERMKAGTEHSVPLSDRAVAILREVLPLAKGSADAPLFPGQKGQALSGMSMAMLMRRLGRDETVHGTARSAFRDWAAECTGYAHEVCEMALAHTIGNKAEAAYRRGNLFDKRRRLMADWADYCASAGAAGGNVTPIRAEAG